jgi:quinoprotein glucose dehydrogenase
VALADREKSVRVAGLDLLASMDVSKDLMVSLLSNVIDTKTTEEKQAALVTLGTLPAENTGKTFERLLDKMAKGNLPPEVHLELAEAIQASNSAPLQSRLESVRATLAPDTLLAAYQDALFGGDPRRGARIVYQHQSAQCMRCHAYGDYGGNAGPRLNGIASRISREQILEALVDPSKRLAPGFGVVTVEVKGGQTISGILQEENAQSLAIRVGSQPDTVIRKDQIVNRTNAPSSMPNMKNLLTKREIRDLVSFLSTLKNEDEAASVRRSGH